MSNFVRLCWPTQRRATFPITAVRMLFVQLSLLKVNHLLRFVSTYSSFTLTKRYNLRSNHRCNWCWQSKTHWPPTQSHVYLPGRRTWFPRPLQLPRHANAFQAILLPAAPRKLQIRSHCFGDQTSRRNRSPFFLCTSNWSHQLLRERQCISWFPD